REHRGAAPLQRGDDVAAEKSMAAGDGDPLVRGLDHDISIFSACAPATAAAAGGRSSTWRPITSTSMLVRRKQSSACAGVSTIGSSSLNAGLRSTRTPASP